VKAMAGIDGLSITHAGIEELTYDGSLTTRSYNQSGSLETISGLPVVD
jgi:hypothetical protein